MSKKKLNLKGALLHVKQSSVPEILSWGDDKLAAFLESLLFRYVHAFQPHLEIPLSMLGTWRDLAVACIPESRKLLRARCLTDDEADATHGLSGR